jgi:Ca2+/H+ antiporter, TMEM165/GDT1 family
MEAFLVSAGIVALAEFGDKTQLLALVLAARFRRIWPVIAGIFVATLLNHALAGAVGAWLTILLAPETLRWLVAIAFFAMAAWVMVPEEEDGETIRAPRLGVFGTTVVAFFLAEFGDKTQLATVALVIQFETLVPVIMGTTLGMMIANVPAVLVGDRVAQRLPLQLLRFVAAMLFAGLGVLAITGAGERLGF